jgi:hypothetical protein
MRNIDSATEEGLEDFEVEVHKLDEEIKLDLIVALEALEYIVTYERGYETLFISNPN